MFASSNDSNDGQGSGPEMPSRSVLNSNPNVVLKRQPMFFGEPGGITRFDQVRYKVFENLTDEQQKNYWRPHEINLEKDEQDYKKMPAHYRRIFDKNLAYQTVMDSIASRATLEAFLPWASLPEVEDCIRVWSYFEGIHNRSYQWIQQNLHVDPSVFFDEILRDESIMSRARSIISHYDNFIRYSDKVRVFGYNTVAENEVLDIVEHKRLMYRAMVSVYALESIRFYASFCCTFNLGQQNLMLGNAKIMKLIARDENLHVGISLSVLRNWPKDDPDFAKIAQEEQQFFIDLFDEVLQQEIAWADYLLQDGVMLGLNHAGLKGYLEHRANRYLKNAGFKERYATKQNPLPWMVAWTSGDREQVAPQETEVDNYKVAALKKSTTSTVKADF